MKLLFLIHALTSGGAERVTARLANHWAKKGWDVTILTVASKRLDFYELHPEVRRIALDMSSEGGNAALGIWNNLRRIRAIRGVLKREKPDVVLGMMTTANVLLPLAARGMTGTATIGSERTYPGRLAPESLWGRLRRRTYGRLSAVVAQTEDAKVWLQQNTPARRIAVIPNPVEWPLAVQQPMLRPGDVKTPENRMLLAVGRLETVKGFDLLIDAFVPLATKYPDWSLVIVGEGPERNALQEKITQRALTKRVLLPGVAGNVTDWYSAADLYVLSSRFEGFPNTLAEALAHGVPAICFDCNAGPRDIIRNGIDGVLVPLGDVAALAAALDRLMGDEATRRMFAGRAVEARERFSMETVAGMWESLFMEVRSERG